MNTSNTSNFPVRKTSDAMSVETTGYVQVPISRTDGAKGKSGMCILAPVVSDNVLNVIFNDPNGKEWLRNVVDGLRSKVASSCNKAGKAITSETIGVSSLLDAMKKEEASVRFTKESIETWFKADMVDVIKAQIEAKMGAISSDKKDAILDSYLKGYQVCANRPDNRTMDSKLKNSLTVMLERLLEYKISNGTEYDSPIAEKISDALETMKEASVLLDMLD